MGAQARKNFLTSSAASPDRKPLLLEVCRQMWGDGRERPDKVTAVPFFMDYTCYHLLNLDCLYLYKMMDVNLL